MKKSCIVYQLWFRNDQDLQNMIEIELFLSPFSRPIQISGARTVPEAGTGIPGQVCRREFGMLTVRVTGYWDRMIHILHIICFSTLTASR